MSDNAVDTVQAGGTDPRHVVAGRITRHGGAAAAGVAIVAVARRIRSETQLGEAITDSAGRYRIEYPAPAVQADLVVRAAAGGEPPVEVVRPDAAASEVVDIALPGPDRSEYESLLADVQPLLDGVAVKDLAEDEAHQDFSFLARATGRDAARIAMLALAARDADATGLPAEQFYGLLRQGMPTDLSNLAQRPLADVRTALAAAVDAKVIAAAGGGVTDADFADRLRAFEVAVTVNPAAGATTSPIGEIFAVAIADPAARERVYGAYLDRTGGLDAFFSGLSEDPASAGYVDRLRLALQLATATNSNAALVRAVLAKFDSGELGQPRDLVKLHDSWATLAERSGGAPEAFRALLDRPVRKSDADPGARVVPVVRAEDASGAVETAGAVSADVTAKYADTIRSWVAEAYPTASVAYQLSVHPRHADAPGTRFLLANPDFDLLGKPVNSATVPDAAARAELGEIQRTFKITRRFETMQALRDNGFTSSYSIAGIGRDRFAAKVAGAVSADEAKTIHGRASQVHATAVNLVADVRTAGQIAVPWLPKIDAAATAQVPNWTELFGSPDYCACSDCRTIYSEAAYLVDLLYFLERVGIGVPPSHGGDAVTAARAGAVQSAAIQPAASTDPWATDPLYLRRPDIWDVQLSCDNTNLSLPYIDLVNELLESAVSPTTAIDPTLRQSSGDPAQLRIQPQHVNAGAYDKLRAAVYPWNLPFDLWGEQVRTYLGSLGVSKAELLSTLTPFGQPTRVNERLGLNTVEARIIAGEALTPPRVLAEFYGQPATMSDAALWQKMFALPALLAAADMVYADIVALLETRFVNPGAAISIVGTNVSTPCDISTLQLQGLSPTALDPLHRFVRLQRALGWTPAQLDRVLHVCSDNGLLDATALRAIAALSELAGRLGLSIDDVLCFYAPLETYNYPSESTAPKYDQLFLNAAVVTPRPDTPNPFLLNADRTELANSASLADPVVTAALLAVLQVSDEELTQLTVGPRAVITQSSLNLAELSALVRTVTLARALGKSIDDLLRLIELAGPQGPFSTTPTGQSVVARTEAELAGGEPMLPPAHPTLISPAPQIGHELASGMAIVPDDHTESSAPVLSMDRLVAITEWFVAAVQAIGANGLAVADLDAVLADIAAAQGGVIPGDSALAATLTSLRSGLQAVYQQTAQTTDEKGDLTRKDLALLGWDTNLVQDAVSTLLGTATYTAALAALPAGVVLPGDVSIRFESIDATRGQLVLLGPLTAAQRAELNGLSNDATYLAAVQDLFNQPRTFVTTRMKSLRIPIYTAPLAAWPADVQLPVSLVGKVFFDAGQQALCSRVYLSDADVAALAAASADNLWKQAVAQLAKSQQAPPDPANALLTAADAAAMFDTTVAAADRFRRVLTIVAPYLRRTLSETTVKQQLGQAAGLDVASTDLLLSTWLHSPLEPTALADFLTPGFVGSDPAVLVTRAGFDEQFTMLELLHRVALLLSRLRITAKEIPFVFTMFGSFFSRLPLTAAPGASPLFADLIDLLGLVRLRASIPGGIVNTLQPLFAAATASGATSPSVERELATLTGWRAADVHTFGALLELSAPTSFTQPADLQTLADAFALLGRLGVAADRVPQWLRPDVTADAAQAAWLAAKAQHSITDWPAVATPPQDAIRDHQRTALVAYLVANPLTDSTGVPQWTDTDGMHDYFLLDVEIGPSQQTTRIAQAIFSVQLFVQRVLLNLEIPVQNGDDTIWSEWEWMKQYQLWAANQKVFLYPENYFEPDLRADATPIFADLRNELMQKDVTNDNLETALYTYIEGLGEVARLHPCGLYHDWSTGTEIVYLIGKTETPPISYYWRAWTNNRSHWTPWQKIDLDIQSETVLPVVMNSRLYLVWPTFTKASDPQAVTDLPGGGHTLTAPPTYWNIQLNWSKYVNGRWLAKRTSDTLMTTDHLDLIFTPERFEFLAYDNGDDTLAFVAQYNQFFSADPQTSFYYVGFAYISMAREEAWSDGIKMQTLTGKPTDYSTPRSEPLGTTTFYNEFMEVSGDTWAGSLWVPDILGKTQTPGWFDLVMTEVLGTVPKSPPFFLLYPNVAAFDDWRALVMTYTDANHSYVIEPYLVFPETGAWGLRFRPIYHPQVETFVRQLDVGGFDGLYSRDLQVSPPSSFDFTDYKPLDGTAPAPYPGPGEPIEFETGAAYGEYNWELFFHAPLMVAQRLGTNQQFSDAQAWFHRIFDPTDRSGNSTPQRFWRTKPFFQTTAADYLAQRIENIMQGVAGGDPAETNAVNAWLANPFQPDVVARLRTTAYQKAVVMKYQDNLIAWGDQLFSQDTLESINQATQLYILAAELLGPRPDEVTGRGDTSVQSYRQLHSTTTVAAAVTAAENILPAPTGAVSPAIAPGLGVKWLDYFCLPRNEKLVGYWDTVADRLFKVRNGLNLQGAVSQASAFGSVIDPSLLVRATAAGVDLATVLDDMSAPLPFYRFAAVVAKAREFAAEVKAFGAALLSAMEKRDAEALARLRSGNEIAMLIAARGVKVQQAQEAADSLTALQQSQAIAQQKHDYYKSRPFMNEGEEQHSFLTRSAVVNQAFAADIEMAASLIGYLPDLKIGFPTTIGATWGSSNIIAALKGMSGSATSNATIDNTRGGMAATMGGYHRRADDWGFQRDQAAGEVAQLGSQIAAARVRADIAVAELANHDLQIKNAKSQDQFLYDKYTNEELYDWLVGRLSTGYFQAYQLAYDAAKRAERAYRHELGLDDSGFIQFGYWDNLHSGLLAGERLTGDLNRLDASYLELNAREFELTKRISLAQVDPNALLRLKETGSCFVSLPEALFDLDNPGHYFRRLKNVSITVPCVAGPYTGVNLTATLLNSSVRVSSTLSSGKYARQPGDTRFRDYTGPIESIVTSTGQDDAGLFETNLHDERFLPFEGAGAISEWRLSLPDKFRQFDYESITDVVLHLRYTARDGGSALGTPAVGEMAAAVNAWVHGDGGKSLYRAFSVRREYADQWNRLLNPVGGGNPTMTFTMSKARFPYLFRDEHITAAKPEFVLVLSKDLVPGEARRYVDAYTSGVLQVSLTAPGGAPVSAPLAADPSLDHTPRVGFDQLSAKVEDAGQDWAVALSQVGQLDPVLLTSDGRLNPDAVVDVLLVWQYTLEDSQ